MEGNKLKAAYKIFFLLGSLFIITLSFVLGINIFASFVIISFVMFISSAHKFIKIDSFKDYLIVALLFVLFIFVSNKLIEFNISVYYIPVAGLVMLIAVLFNDMALTFIGCVLASVIAGIISGGSFFNSLIFLISGLVAGAYLWQLRKRVKIFTAGLYAGIIQMLLFMIAFDSSPKAALPCLFNGIICGVVVTGILPLFENLFGIATNISLLELSDFNHPLLKQMILEAPGTYHHSLVVGNISEAAAEEIGANSLLARIGAYYHDIGKLANSEYFMENQKDTSKHSGLAPSMSKMVIMNHIKEGVELAKKYRLKPAIVDFIIRHHGTSLVYYFYRKALEEIDDDAQVHEDGFRYMGPKPNSKETAIVLLADSVEAASRVLDDPQPVSIAELVHKIINNKFIDGQLDDCDLTLRDLEKISKIFIHMLGGIYHDRIKYPEDKRESSNNKKHNKKKPAD